MQVGTGNYNSANSKLYTDISLITSNPIITKDIESFFKVRSRDLILCECVCARVSDTQKCVCVCTARHM